MKKCTLLLGTALLVGAGFYFNNAGAQAIRDRNVVPVAVNLNEVLRMTITNGGNIEFVFNTIDDYKFGLSGDAALLDNPQDAEIIAGGNIAANPSGANNTGSGAAVGDVTAFPAATQPSPSSFYRTDFMIAASVRWAIEWGTEEANLIGTDDPTASLLLDNVGLGIVNQGTHDFELPGSAITTTATRELFSTPLDNAGSITALRQYATVEPLIQDNVDPTFANAGDGNENNFSLLWRCGTTEAGNIGGVAGGTYPMNALSLLNQGDIVPDRYITNVVFELRRDF